MNNNADYNLIIPYKVTDIIAFIMTNNNLSFREAVDYLYNSKFYVLFSREQTKLWHLSSYKLFDILNEEMKTGELILPDFI